LITGVKRIFGSSHGFVGREAELERLMAAANGGQSLAVLGAPGVGTSELLRHAFDKIFLGSQGVIPIYFEIRRSDESADVTARRFARDFLTQSIAFRRRDADIVGAAPTLGEIERLAPPDDAKWIDTAIEAIDRCEDDLRFCLSLPDRAPGRYAVFVDNADVSRKWTDADKFLDLLRSDTSGAFVVAGLRRWLFGKLPWPQMRLGSLGVTDAGHLAEAAANENGVTITDQTRDLLAVQLESNASDITSLLRAAADSRIGLTDFRSVERIYTDSVYGGLIAHRYSRMLGDRTDSLETVRSLVVASHAPDGRTSIESWTRSFDEASRASRVLERLHLNELVSVDSGFVDTRSAGVIFRDYLAARSALEIDGKRRAIAVGEACVRNIARAPRLMTQFYRSAAAIGIRELLLQFGGQSIPAAAIDYTTYKIHFKGREESSLRADDETGVDLPRVVYAAHAATFYPPLLELCDLERSAIALADSGESWIMAEIDSKLEADAETTEFWCDRLEMAALNSGLDQIRIWLIAPEGFDEPSMELLAGRGGYGSSHKQVGLLKELLSRSASSGPDTPVAEYEITVPMGDEGEMVATRTIDEIAADHRFAKKAATQIKTALVEALINAAEHSLSPDRRVELKFQVFTDRLRIAVSNRGVRLIDRMPPDTETTQETRRGWGLKLIRGLMDDVRIDDTDDGTRLVMVKHLDTVEDGKPLPQHSDDV
jgi:anti-sigma regulatory factor (Ser/Thr protein kinase)